MLIAKCKSGYISALKAEPDDGPFRCPECKLEVILKKGDIYVHHFAHNPGEGCAFGEYDEQEGRTGESELHRFAKKEIYEALAKHKGVTNLKLERFLDSVRPDISFYFNGVPVAIEMQVSAIRPDVIVRRTIEYTRRGVFILWVSPYGGTEIRDGRNYSMRDWERIIHALYGGTFYYWMESEQLLPSHFENALTHKSAEHLSGNMQIPRMRESVFISDLAPISRPFRFTGEPLYQETRLWCLPEVWIDAEDRYMTITDATAMYPSLFPAVRSFPPLDDPFHAEDAPSSFSLRGWVKEMVPELKDLFLLFYAKYGMSDLKKIWVSIDESPNRFYFAPDWWQRFRLEYLEANANRRERLVEMLQEKLSGEKPSRHVKWPPKMSEEGGS